MTGASAWVIGVAALAVGVLGACGRTEPSTPNTQPVQVPAPLNSVSASDVMASIIKAGLPAPNSRDVTALKCPKLHCLSAVDSDTVSILTFPATGPAQLYAGAISNVYQVENVVLTFTATVTPEQKQAYERIAAGLK